MNAEANPVGVISNEHQPQNVKGSKPATPKDLIEAGLGSRNWVYSEIKKGNIPVNYIGNKIIIDKRYLLSINIIIRIIGCRKCNRECS